MSACGCIWGDHPEANAECRYPALLKAAEILLERTTPTRTAMYSIEEAWAAWDGLKGEVERAKEKA